MYRRLNCMFFLILFLGLALTNSTSAELIGWWRLDEGSGTMAFDSSGYGNDARFEGSPMWVDDGKLGKALRFNGSSDYLASPDSESLDINGDQLSIAAWINGEDWPAANHVVRKVADTGTGSIYILRVQPDSVRVYLNTSAGETIIQGRTALTTNEWFHIALTYDGAEARIFVNGQLDVSSDVSGELTQSNNELRIGRGEPAGYFVGMIDDVRLYNHALTESELLSAMEGGGAEYPFARGPNPADGALHSNTWANISWLPGDNAVSHDIYLGDNFDDVNNGAEGTFHGNQTGTFIVVGFPGFAYPDGLVPGMTYYWRIDEVNEAEPNSPWKGDVWSFSIPPKTAYFPNPADDAESVGLDVELSWTAGYGAKLHTIYFGENFDDLNNETGGLPQGKTTYTPPGPLKLAQTYYWRVDEFDAIETYKGHVWSFTTQGAVGNPNPANGAVDVKQTQIITWSPSVYAASHQLYFGTDKDAVKNADT
ncbi:MAG: LamG domain-containing protein, partial [Phycisphaerae bacterium]